jgi:hypothetical protein
VIRELSTQQSQSASPGILPEITTKLSRAERMKHWIIDQCNRIHIQWNVSIVDEKPLLEALETLSGEKIPDWLPVRVRFEAEDGEMVMKLDYENKTGSYSEKIDVSNEPPRKARTPHPGTTGQEWQREYLGVQELPYRDGRNGATTQNVGFDNKHKNACLAPSWTTRPVDFMHSTGRGLCSTSGWWPDTPRTSTVLLDSTHKASAFSRMPRHSTMDPEDALVETDSYPC